MGIVYKKKNTLKQLFKDFMWKHETFGFVLLWSFMMCCFIFVMIFAGVYLSRDTTKPEEINDVRKTTIMVKKKNGLLDEISISSNGELEVDFMPLRSDVLTIKENGENSIGIGIKMEMRIENVDSFYVKRGK